MDAIVGAIKALEVAEATVGPDHHDVALSLNNLAGLYNATGQYEQAVPLCERALAIQEKALGPGHPNVATSLEHLALLYRATGCVKTAEAFDMRAVAITAKQR